MSEAQRADNTPATLGFVPVNLPAAPSAPGNPSDSGKRSTIRIEIPHAGGTVVVELPAEQVYQCAALLRDLFG